MGGEKGGQGTLQVFRLNLSPKQDLFREKSYNHTIKKNTYKMVLEYCHLKSPQHSIKQWGSFTEGFSSPNFKQRTFDSENTQRKILQGRGGPNILKEESIFT